MDDLSQEEVFIKKKFLSFFKELGHVGGIVSPDSESNKLLERFTETLLHMDAYSKRG